MSADEFLGLWVGYSHPLQESRIVFCADGRGAFFYFWGACRQTPFVDTFSWTPEEVDCHPRLRFVWDTFHGDIFDENDNNIPLATEQADNIPADASPEHDGPEYPVHHNIALIHEYSFKGDGAERTLDFFGSDGAIGDYVDFERIRPAGASDAEIAELSQYRKGFNPFGSARTVWQITQEEDGTSRFRPAMPVPAGALAGKEVEISPEEFSELFRLRVPGRVLTVVFGIIGLCGYTADYSRQQIPFLLRFAILLVPFLIYFLPTPEKIRPASRESRFYAVAAVWYFFLIAGIGILAATGLRPRGWWFYLLMCLPGAVTFLYGLSRLGKACLNTELNN